MRRKLKTDSNVETSFHDRLIKYCEEFLPSKKRIAVLFLFRGAIREAKDEAELALMRGEVRHLGEKHMLLSHIYSGLSMTSRPMQRETAFRMFKQALDTYLGIRLRRPLYKGRRRKLLAHAGKK